jgi:hypothetical protein
MIGYASIRKIKTLTLILLNERIAALTLHLSKPSFSIASLV